MQDRPELALGHAGLGGLVDARHRRLAHPDRPAHQRDLVGALDRAGVLGQLLPLDDEKVLGAQRVEAERLDLVHRQPPVAAAMRRAPAPRSRLRRPGATAGPRGGRRRNRRTGRGRAHLVDRLEPIGEVLAVMILEQHRRPAVQHQRVTAGVVHRPDLHVRAVERVADVAGIEEQDAARRRAASSCALMPAEPPGPRRDQGRVRHRAPQRPVRALGVEVGRLARVLEDLRPLEHSGVLHQPHASLSGPSGASARARAVSTTPGSGRTVMCITGVGLGPAGLEAEARKQSGEDDLRLHHREVRADANPRAGAEGQVQEAVARRALRSGAKLSGIEFVRVLPPHPVAVQRVDVEEDRLVRQDVAAAEPVGLADVAREQPDRRIEAHRLLDHLLDIGHPLEVLGAGGAVAEHGTRLGAGAGLDILVVGQQEQRPGQRQRRGLVPGDDEELHVVQQIARGHPPPGLGILGAQHVVEQVVGACRRRLAAGAPRSPAPPCGAWSAPRRAPSSVAGPRDPVRHLEEIEQRRPADGQEIAGDRRAVDIGIEVLAPRQRHLADHVEGRRQHLAHHLRTGPPAAAMRAAARSAVARHHRRKRRHVARGEDRRDGAALPAPMRALGGEEAIADRRPQHPDHHLGFRVVVDVVEKDPPQRPGPLHHVPARRAGAPRSRSAGCRRSPG